MQKKNMVRMRVDTAANHVKCEHMVKSSKALTSFVKTSEHYRKEFSDKLRQVLSEKDEHANQI
jgi:3-methyladenine DNA glycosylase AlkC